MILSNSCAYRRASVLEETRGNRADAWLSNAICHLLLQYLRQWRYMLSVKYLSFDAWGSNLPRLNRRQTLGTRTI